MKDNIKFAITKAMGATRRRAKHMAHARVLKATGVPAKLTVQFAREDNRTAVYWLRRAREWMGGMSEGVSYGGTD